MKLNRLYAEYDRLYEEASAILREHNPCQIRRDGEMVTCTSYRSEPKYDSPAGSPLLRRLPTSWAGGLYREESWV